MREIQEDFEAAERPPLSPRPPASMTACCFHYFSGVVSLGRRISFGTQLDPIEQNFNFHKSKCIILEFVKSGDRHLLPAVRISKRHINLRKCKALVLMVLL